MAWRIKALQGKKAMNEIQNDPREINDSFKTFYNRLYKSETPCDPEIETEFLDGIQFPSLSEEERANLDAVAECTHNSYPETR